MDKMRELVESVAVALLNVRNSQGKRLVVPNPMRYAEMIAHDLRSNTAPHMKDKPAPKPRVTWVDPETQH